MGFPQELKTSLLPGPILALECDRIFEAEELVAGLPGVYEAVLYGALIHVSVADAAKGEATGHLALKTKSRSRFFRSKRWNPRWRKRWFVAGTKAAA